MDNSRISKHLGQVSQYKSNYDPELLVREPRQSNRVHLDIKDEELPFKGVDVWNAYEVSALTDDGLPFTGVLKIVYPCSSKYIVESKSIKLYLNSFNSERMGKNVGDAVHKLVTIVEADLSELLGTAAYAHLALSDTRTVGHVDAPLARADKFITLEKNFQPACDTYVETPDLLKSVPRKENKKDIERVHSALLKSNCRVTSQPDWGDVYIEYYDKDKDETVCLESLLRYIVSFRDECHFHEEICETIFKRLQDKFNFSQLCVTCLYARRGGIDINPVRSTDTRLINNHLTNPNIVHIKTMKQ